MGTIPADNDPGNACFRGFILGACHAPRSPLTLWVKRKPGEEGFEPRMAGPKPAALPLGDSPTVDGILSGPIGDVNLRQGA